jgi:hypothetical protein
MSSSGWIKPSARLCSHAAAGPCSPSAKLHERFVAFKGEIEQPTLRPPSIQALQTDLQEQKVREEGQIEHPGLAHKNKA